MKPIFFKKISVLLLVLSFYDCKAQTLITINSCDTTISSPSIPYPDNNTYYDVTIHSATGSRLAYNVEGFISWYGDLYIYNGPSISSPLLDHLGDYFDVPNQLYGGQSTGSDITLHFRGHGIASPKHFRVRVRCVEAPSNERVFQPIVLLPATGNIKAADYDNDGDTDIVAAGKIFRNDSYKDTLYQFERKFNVLDGWSNVNMCTADFDNDGYKDIFVTGFAAVWSSTGAATAALYRNNGNGTFKLVSSQQFPGVYRGACSVVDFNRDGKPDICYTGSVSYYTQPNYLYFKIYLNNGNMQFTDAGVSLPGIPGLVNANISWADSDGDGDSDLLVNGHNGTINLTRLFTVNGNEFTNVTLPVTVTSRGKLSWVDVNGDGRPDIFNDGIATVDNVDGITPEILFNNGSNSFTKVNTNLPRLIKGSVDWYDYDHDGDLDIIRNGVKVPSGNGFDAAVYRCDSNGLFTRVTDLSWTTGSSLVKWFDFNKDGKMDIIGPDGYFLKNMGADSFRVASFKAPSTTYSIDRQMLIDDFNNDGNPDLLMMGGGFRDIDCNQSASSGLVLGKGWKWASVPVFKQVVDLSTRNPIVEQTGYATAYYYQWGDFDSDGKPDIMMTGDNIDGTGTGFVAAYKNNGSDSFSLYFNSQATPLPPAPVSYTPKIRAAGLFDIDNDGINELLLTPNVVYKKTGNQWNIFSASPENTAGDATYMDFTDFNKDGFMDAAVNGTSGIIILRNDGAGHMVNITIPPPGYAYGTIGSAARRQIQWADMNNDGYPDLVSSAGIYENKIDSFVYVHSQITPFVHAAVADINGDGYKDVIALPDIYNSEHGTSFFDRNSLAPVSTAIQNFNEGVVSFDIDNDGDADLIFTQAGCDSKTTVFINEGIPVFNLRGPAYTIANGNWSDAATWNGHVVPLTGADVVIKHNVAGNLNAVCNTLQVIQPGSLIVNTGISLTVLH